MSSTDEFEGSSVDVCGTGNCTNTEPDGSGIAGFVVDGVSGILEVESELSLGSGGNGFEAPADEGVISSGLSACFSNNWVSCGDSNT